MKNLNLAIFKLDGDQLRYEVYDDEGIYYYSIKATYKNKNDLINMGYKFQEPKPVSGDHDHCYGCATMRHPCIDEGVIL